MQLSELGELGLLAELERRGLAQGIDHDAAQLEGGVVATQDALVEGVHFRLDWISWRDLGWRAAAVNLSDLAASGAEPEGLLVALGAPPDTDVRRRHRAVRGNRRDEDRRDRRRHDPGGSALVERDRDRPLAASAGQGGRPRREISSS